MGTFAVQLAKSHFGCYVVASCSSPNAMLVKSLGADQVVDYASPTFLQCMSASSCDVIVDCVGGDDYWQAFKGSLAKDGVYVTTVGNKRYREATSLLSNPRPSPYSTSDGVSTYPHPCLVLRGAFTSRNAASPAVCRLDASGSDVKSDASPPPPAVADLTDVDYGSILQIKADYFLRQIR